MTSSILSPRRLLALCSPITHVIASATLLLPHPLGPTIAVTPLSKASSDRSENDLKPLISRRSRRMYTPSGNCGLPDADCGRNPQSKYAARNPPSAIRRGVEVCWETTWQIDRLLAHLRSHQRRHPQSAVRNPQ